MNETKIAIERIEVRCFKKIRDLVLEPGEGANVLFGEYRSGKTSLCEFIRFALYGAEAVSLPKGASEDACGSLLFRRGEELFRIERRVENDTETLVFTDEVKQAPVETELTPGEYLTGLERRAFDTVAYFRQARYETPVFRPGIAILDQIASFQPETENVYRKEEFTNDEKTGSLDRAEAKLAAVRRKLDEGPERSREIARREAALAEIASRIDENEKRVVIIKADMAGFSDDLKIARNKENAAQLKREIQAKEKRLRLMKYEVSNKTGLLERSDAEALKEDYNRYSLALTELGEARNTLASAQETLSFHEGMFTGRDGAEHFEKEAERIKREKKKRLWMNVAGVASAALGVMLGIALRFLNFDWSVCLAAAGTLLLCGVALFSAGQIFTMNIHRILSENGKKDLAEFYETCEKLEAHAKTTQVYREAVEKAEKECEKERLRVDGIRERIHKKLFATGRKIADGDLLALCDQIVDANEGIFDLEDEIRAGWEEYLSKLSKDVEREDLEVSPEFDALQKELFFLTKQSESLAARRDALTAETEGLKLDAVKEKELRAEAENAAEEVRRENHLFEVVKMDLALAESNRARFEAKLKEALTLSIHRKIGFLLKEGEGFLFDEDFELCYRDRASILPVLSLGGGQLAEMGLLAFRLGLAELLNKNDLPMIFDDPFTYLGPEEVRQFYEMLRSSCGQFFLSTSSREVAHLCADTARILSV